MPVGYLGSDPRKHYKGAETGGSKDVHRWAGDHVANGTVLWGLSKTRVELASAIPLQLPALLVQGCFVTSVASIRGTREVAGHVFQTLSGLSLAGETEAGGEGAACIRFSRSHKLSHSERFVHIQVSY